LVSAKTTDKIGLSRCWQNAVIFLNPHTCRQLVQESTANPRQDNYLSAMLIKLRFQKQDEPWSTCWLLQPKLKFHHLIRLIKYHGKILKLLQKKLAHKS